MAESTIRKNKITLSDYDYRKDIENRLLLAQFSIIDLEVLEGIIYSSLSISVKKLAKDIDIEETELFSILEKFAKTGLLTYDEDLITVDKDRRKYYEMQILMFDEEYQNGMDFLQNLLKKVPIHILPTWYSIPRTSNNIFESLVEKYLLTPQIFQRYLMELQFPEPVMSSILKDVYNSEDLKLPSQVLIEKYQLTRERFEEYLLVLEFNFVCCLGYEKINNTWKEVVTPYHEYREYLRFLKQTEPSPFAKQIENPKPFAFIQEMSAVLNQVKKTPSPMTGKIVDKLRLLKLADIVDGRLYALDAANDFLDMPLENRAIFVYRHPLNRFIHPLATEKNIREAEKSIIRILNKGWVAFDEFFKGVLAPLNETSSIMLKKLGRTWKYTIPEYTDEEQLFIKSVLFDWLYEAGITATATIDGKECFCVTPFGQTLFGR